MEDINERIVIVDGFKDQFLACWYAIKRVIQEEIPEPSDIGFLMEVMGDMATQIKDTTKAQKMKLTLRKWIGAWNCVNICLRNNLFKSEGQQAVMCEILSILATKIDANSQMDSSPDELMPNNPPKVKQAKQGLGIIDGGKDE